MVGRSARCESTIWNASPPADQFLCGADASLVLRAIGSAHRLGRSPRRLGVDARRAGQWPRRPPPVAVQDVGRTGDVVEAHEDVGDDEPALRDVRPCCRAVAPSARAARRGRSRGSRRPARRPLGLLEGDEPRRRSRRTNGVRAVPGRPTRAETTARAPCAQPQVGRERRDEVGVDGNGHGVCSRRRKTTLTGRRGRAAAGCECGAVLLNRVQAPALLGAPGPPGQRCGAHRGPA